MNNQGIFSSLFASLFSLQHFIGNGAAPTPSQPGSDLLSRILTITIGLILLVVGLVALTRGPAVQIVGGAIKEAAVS